MSSIAVTTWLYCTHHSQICPVNYGWYIALARDKKVTYLPRKYKTPPSRAEVNKQVKLYLREVGQWK